MLKSIDFIEAGFWRYSFAIILLILLTDWKNLILHDFKKNYKGIFLVGFLGLFGFNLFFFGGLLYTSAVNAALIMSLNPALTLLLSNRILKTPLPFNSILGFLIALSGVAYLISKGNILNLANISLGIGDLLILFANILFALHHVWVKKYAVHLSTMHFTLATNFICLICFLFLIPFSGINQLENYPGSFWLSAAGIGFLGTGLAYFLWNKGVKEVGAHRAGIFMNVVPLTTAFLAFFYNEPLYYYHIVSGIIILAGFIFTFYTPSFLVKLKL